MKVRFKEQLRLLVKNIQETSLFDLSFDVGTVLQDTDGQFIGLTVAEDIAFALENDAVEQAEMKKSGSENGPRLLS